MLLIVCCFILICSWTLIFMKDRGQASLVFWVLIARIGVYDQCTNTRIENLIFILFSSVAQSCLTLCHPMDCSMPGLPVHHQFLEFTQTHVQSCRRCHPTISSSVVPFSSCLQSFSASGSFPMSQFFTSGGQSIGVSASTSVLPMNSQDWSPIMNY